MISPETIKTQETSNKYIIESYVYPNLGNPEKIDLDEYAQDGYRVEVVMPSDYRVAAAREMEVATMVALGDPEEEVREEFLPYNDSSVYFLAFDKHTNGEVDEIAAMGRVIPFNTQNSNKTLLDLAVIPGWVAEGIPTVTGLDSNQDEIVIHDTKSVIEAFCAETGCADLSKVWDISTMAPNFDFVLHKKMNAAHVAKSILAAVSEYGITAYKNGELTHITSFNEQHANQFFTKVGYPFKKMFGLEPMLYDSFGTAVGMVAQPAWFSVEEFTKKVDAADPHTYLGQIATSLRARQIL